MFICCSNCLCIWAYQSLYSGVCNNANDQIRSNDDEQTWWFPLAYKICFGKISASHQMSGWCFHFTAQTLGSLKIPPGKYHLVVLVSQTNSWNWSFILTRVEWLLNFFSGYFSMDTNSYLKIIILHRRGIIISEAQSRLYGNWWNDQHTPKNSKTTPRSTKHAVNGTCATS